jgi:ubiquinone/menaquinone biosynthesis C-methylase UbiE
MIQNHNHSFAAQLTWDATYTAKGLEASVWSRLPFVDDAVGTFPTVRDGVFLELPCGGGRNTIPLANRLPRLVAVDASAAALGLARRVLEREQIRNCLLMRSDVRELPFVDATFDGVFCADLLGHLPEPRAAISELLRVSRPGARVVVNFFGPEDSTREDPEAQTLSDTEMVYRDVMFRYDDPDAVQQIVAFPHSRLISLEEFRWGEAPHPGYRDYPHEHHTVLAVLERRP